MDLIAKVTCSGCSAVIKLTVRSAEHAEEKLAAAGWTACSGGDGHLCSTCSKPSIEPTSTPRETKPSDYASSAAQLEPILRDGKFTHEPAGDIWRTGPDFCWLESMSRQEWPQDATLCVRVHYALGRAKRESDSVAYTTLDRVHHREGLGRLTAYLAQRGFRAREDARDGETTHLIVYRLAGHESNLGVETYA
ncbi:hypothetical protein [Streptomyces parvus]|uniref:hypothetical protein n=1 Tax=Streptomyces parvus TaxID=66428 RepID=UPI002101069A|nr:hypothetical protein [Streptomyces parvus]MCQ1577205.1 hypothetical protein [Streptomyces parvus]